MVGSATKVLVGHSRSADAREAAREAVAGLSAEVDRATFALVFATPDYASDDLAAALSEELGETPWAGCSAPRVFAGLEVIAQGLVVGLIVEPRARVGVGVAQGIDDDPRAAGQRAVAAALREVPAPDERWHRLMILLPDTSSGSGPEVVRGALSEGGNGVVWAGGGAGDLSGATTLSQFAQGRAHRDSCVAVAIDLPAPPGTGVRHGWRPFGPAAMVTRALGNVAHELEYRGAFEVYRDTAKGLGTMLDDASFADFAMFHPLGIPQGNGHYLVRDPIGLEGDGLRCVAEIRDGALVRVMRADRSDIVAAAGEAAHAAQQMLGHPAAGALVFDCVSRHMVLGESFRDELEAFRRALGDDVPVFGCLTYGEIAAFGREVPQFHNKTTVVVALGGKGS